MKLNATPPCHSTGPRGRYINCFKIGYNMLEVVIDFGQGYPEEETHYHTRIITTPTYAKALLESLSDSLRNYEREYGIIK